MEPRANGVQWAQGALRWKILLPSPVRNCRFCTLRKPTRAPGRAGNCRPSSRTRTLREFSLCTFDLPMQPLETEEQSLV
jgi:hypothetical protein